MVTRADIKFALLVGIPLALVTMLAFRFGPIFSEPLLVPNMPLDQFLALPHAEQGAFLHASPQSLRPVTGFEKIAILLRTRPGLYLAYWFILALPICGAILLGAWAARRRQEPNPALNADAERPQRAG